MKFINKLTTGIVSMGLFVTAFAETAPASKPIKFELPAVGSTSAQPAAAPATVAPAAPAVPAVKFTQTQMMEAYGIILALQKNLADLEFTAADVDAMAQGIKMVIAQEKPVYDIQAIGPQLQEFVGQRQQALLGKIHDQNVAMGTAFFAKLKDNKSVQILPSGLGIEVLKPASGPTAKLGQVAKFHYTLSALNGQVVESTAGHEPMEGLVEKDSMIPGMVEALQKIPVGAKYKVYIPYQLAFGEQGGQNMPPAASLIFEVEMLEVKDAPKEAAPAGK